jgi:hypothetical protein
MGYSTKRGQTCEIFLNGKQFYEERARGAKGQVPEHYRKQLLKVHESDDCISGLLAPVPKGERLIILHAGGHHGFIPNSLDIFKSNQKTGDYHNEINGENHIRWLKEKLIPNLEPNSVLVIDNSPYHNTQKDKAPTSNQIRKQ